VVRSYKIRINGQRQIAAFSFPGDTFGIEGGEEHAFSADAVADAKILAIKRRMALSLAALDNEIARELWTLTCQEIDRAQSHTLLLSLKAPERLASFLLEMAARMRSPDEVELPMSRQDIADYVGLTIETVSRELTKLEKASVVGLSTSRRVELLDLAALRRLSSYSTMR
jgi:CRP/FNR family transcriptional regulator, nitrogen fixation regulation protein